MAREVRFRPQAESDLFALYSYIAGDSGPARAMGYIDRIEAVCMALADFPERGTLRDDIGGGVRTIGFERRVTIAFRVEPGVVRILRVLYGGRAIENAFRDTE